MALSDIPGKVGKGKDRRRVYDPVVFSGYLYMGVFDPTPNSVSLECMGGPLDIPILSQDWVFRMLSLQNNYTIKNKRSVLPWSQPQERTPWEENQIWKEGLI